jgi:hypothetical protein
VRGIRVPFTAWVIVAVCTLAPAVAAAAPPSVNATIIARHNSASAGWYNVPVRISFRNISWDDPMMGGTYDISAISYTRNGGSSVSVASTSTLGLRRDGHYVVEAEGTWGGFASPIEFGIDRTPPVSRSDVHSTYVASAAINIAVADATSGPGKVWYCLDNKAKVTAPVSASGPKVVVSAGPGKHVLTWGSVDAAGNAERCSHAAAFVVNDAASKGWLSAPRVRVRGRHVSFRGDVSRATGSTRVKLIVERKSGRHWRVFARYSVNVHQGAAAYSTSHALRPGRYRVTVHSAFGKSRTTYFRRH